MFLYPASSDAGLFRRAEKTLTLILVAFFTKISPSRRNATKQKLPEWFRSVPPAFFRPTKIYALGSNNIFKSKTNRSNSLARSAVASTRCFFHTNQRLPLSTPRTVRFPSSKTQGSPHTPH